MALEQTFKYGSLDSGSSSNCYTMELYVKETSTSVEENSSEVYYELRLCSGGNNRFANYSTGYAVALAGQTVAYRDRVAGVNQLKLDFNSTIVVCSGTATVAHEDDGSKEMAVAFWVDQVADSYGFGYHYSSDTMTLTTIARPSVPTVSTKTATMGSPLTIYTNRNSTAFSNSLHYKLDDGWNDIGWYVEDSYEWTPPVGLAAHVPENRKLENFGIMCRTWKGKDRNNDKDIIGDEWVNIDLVVPNNEETKPDVKATVSPNNNAWLLSTNLKNDDLKNLYIQGMSKADVKITADGKFDSVIESFSTTVNGKTYAGEEFTSETLTGSGKLTITARATDSRGIRNVANSQIDVIPYSKPLVKPINGNSAVVCSRCDAEGNLTSSGTSLKIAAKRSFSPVLVNNSPANTCTLCCAVKQHTKDDYDSWITLISGETSSTNEYNEVVSAVVLDANKMYDVRIAVHDDLENWDIVEFTIPTEETPLDLAEGGLNVGIGRRAKKDGSRTFDCAWDAYFEKDVYINGTSIDIPVEQAAKGNWYYRKWNSGLAECWGTFFKNITESDWQNWSSSGLYQIPITQGETLPITFTAFPSVHPTLHCPYISTILLTQTRLQDSEFTSTDQYLAVTASEPSSVCFTLELYVVGRWK